MTQISVKNVWAFSKASKNVKRIYTESFPKKEQMPYFMMLLMSLLPNTRLLSFTVDQEETPAGMMYLAKGFSLIFVMFFAVDKNLRSNGYGSLMLKALQDRYPNKKIIITIEECVKSASDFELRCRRRAFYFRNGFKPTGYKIKLAGVRQEIIVAPGSNSLGNADASSTDGVRQNTGTNLADSSTKPIFSKWIFQLFLLFYSCGALIPRIWVESSNNEHKSC